MEKVVLLTDNKSHSWKFAQSIQKYIKEKEEVEISLEKVCINHFRNREIDMHVPANMRQKDVYFIHDSTKNPQEWWVELLLLKDLLKSSSAHKVTFVLPNILYARQDRKPKSHVPVSIRAFIRSISPGLERVITLDLHSQQIQGMFPEDVPIDSLDSFPEVVRYIKENPQDIKNLQNLVVLSPDLGGTKRVRELARRLRSNYPIALIDKDRVNPGKISVDNMTLIGNVKGKDVLAGDDIFDSCGTACEGSKLLRREGARKLIIYATHGMFTKGTKEICKCYDRVITSNTHYVKDNNIEIIDMAPLFGEAIYRAQTGKSISKLFQ